MKNHRLAFREVDRDKYLDIVEGRKPIETRAATVKYRKVAVGDTFTIVCGRDYVIKKITWVRHFRSVDSMLRSLPLEKILPSAENKAQAEKIFYGFPGYRDKIKECGIIAFNLED